MSPDEGYCFGLVTCGRAGKVRRLIKLYADTARQIDGWVERELCRGGASLRDAVLHTHTHTHTHARTHREEDRKTGMEAYLDRQARTQ